MLNFLYFKEIKIGKLLLILGPIIGAAMGFGLGHFMDYQYSPVTSYERKIDGDEREFLIIERRIGRKFLFVKDSEGKYKRFDELQEEKYRKFEGLQEKESDLMKKIEESSDKNLTRND